MNSRSKKSVAPKKADSSSLKGPKADRRRGEILAAAGAALRKHGLSGAGMRQIAGAVGLSPGNLYYYFRNKEELVYFCQDQTLDALDEVARAARAEESPAARIATLVRGHLRALLDTGAAGAIHLEDLDGMPPALHRKLVQKRDRYERSVRELIAAGMRSGELRNGDPKLAAFALLGALNWSARWFHPGGAYSIDQVADGFIDQLLGGLIPYDLGYRGTRTRGK
ncbi:MAG: TetR/AcrR family transcriptional regulator [Polyangia bacterium]